MEKKKTTIGKEKCFGDIMEIADFIDDEKEVVNPKCLNCSLLMICIEYGKLRMLSNFGSLLDDIKGNIVDVETAIQEKGEL